MELDVDDALRDRVVEVPLGDEREVVGLAQQIEHGEVPLEEHREPVEAEPGVDTGDVVGRRANAVAFGERQHRRRIDGALEMHVQLRFGQPPHVLGGKRGAHRAAGQPASAVAMRDSRIAVRIGVGVQRVAEERDRQVALVVVEFGVHDAFDRRREIAPSDDEFVGDLLGRGDPRPGWCRRASG